MRTTGMRFGAASLLGLAALLAACSAVHPGPGARSQAAARAPAAHHAGTRPAGARPGSTRTPARAPGGARLQISRGPWWQREPSPCAPPTLVRAAGHVLGVGTCTGHAVLVSDATGCFIVRHQEGRETTRDCPVATVTVVP